jgi:hypothetical protein
MFLFLRNAELVVCNACVISILHICKFHFTLDSTNVYPMFCLAESKQILVSLLGQNPNSKSMVAICKVCESCEAYSEDWAIVCGTSRHQQQ